MGNIVIFDLYGTVLEDGFFEFKRGITWLYETYFADRCSLQEFLDFSDTFLPLYHQRKQHHREISMMKDELPLYFAQFGVPMPEDLWELDFQIMDHMQHETLSPAVVTTLDELERRGVPMYILSNSIFSGRSAMRLLERFGIAKYFRQIFTSADAGWRKPGTMVFRLVKHAILAENPGATADDIVFVGNDYTADAAGGIDAGLRTVWFNQQHLPNEPELPVIEIDDFSQLLDFVE